jgi:hypothetical protein
MVNGKYRVSENGEKEGKIRTWKNIYYTEEVIAQFSST